MALIKCPECGKEISDAARSCPHCGFPLANKTKEDAKKEPDKIETKDAIKDGVVAYRGGPGGMMLRFILEMFSAIILFGFAAFLFIVPQVRFTIFLGIMFAIFGVWILIASIMGFVYIAMNDKVKEECIYYDNSIKKLVCYTIYGKREEVLVTSVTAIRDSIMTSNLLFLCYSDEKGNTIKLRLGFCSNRSQIKNRIHLIEKEINK